MKLARLRTLCLVLAAAATAAAAQEQPAAPEEQPEKKICRTERATGSLTRRTRICLTATQWREVHSRTKRGLDDFVGAAAGGCRSPGGMGGTMCGG
jgi:hypothetical protein